MHDKEYYAAFWKNQEHPFHPAMDDDAYRRYAEEVNLILEWCNYNGGPVYEVGCGDGSMYRHMKINHEEYFAKDFSEVMIKKFKEREPTVNASYGDGSVVTDIGKPYGLIMGYTVHQNFDWNLLEKHIRQAAELLGSGGIMLIGGQPISNMKYAHYSGQFRNAPETLKMKLYGLLSLLNIPKGVRFMGYWHKPSRIKKLAHQLGMEFQVFGSIIYAYRVNIVLRKR